MQEEQRECVYCGAREELVADEHMEALWYCRACLARREEHRAIIAEGCEDEDPSFE